MIPRAHVTAWRHQAPWPDDDLVEQDLVRCRALVEMFSHPAVAAGLAFRGGTALHKLIFESPLRYSEDIDLVQVQAGPIREVMQAIHEQLFEANLAGKAREPSFTEDVRPPSHQAPPGNPKRRTAPFPSNWSQGSLAPHGRGARNVASECEQSCHRTVFGEVGSGIPAPPTRPQLSRIEHRFQPGVAGSNPAGRASVHAPVPASLPQAVDQP